MCKKISYLAGRPGTIQLNKWRGSATDASHPLARVMLRQSDANSNCNRSLVAHVGVMDPGSLGEIPGLFKAISRPLRLATAEVAKAIPSGPKIQARNYRVNCHQVLRRSPNLGRNPWWSKSGHKPTEIAGWSAWSTRKRKLAPLQSCLDHISTDRTSSMSSDPVGSAVAAMPESGAGLMLDE